MWAQHLQQRNIIASGISGSAARAPLMLLREILAGRRPDAYVFRYLSDYPSLIKTLLRAGSELAVIAIAGLFRIRILWILHNVDKETSEFWPSITRFRRGVIARFCSGAFVTDPLLIEEAARHIPRLTWRSVPFGTEGNKPAAPEAMHQVVAELDRLRTELEATGRPVFIGLCVTSMSPKCAHLFQFSELADAAGKGGWSTGILFVGAFSRSGEQWEEVRERIKKTEGMKVLDIEIKVDEEMLAPHFDFIYRSLNDLSVPYSLYRAAAAGKPVITHEDGLSASIVARYGVGLVSKPGHQDDWPAFFNGWSPDRWNAFLSERSWAIGADRLASAITDDAVIDMTMSESEALPGDRS